MDANSRKVTGLISEMNVRFVVPVYQRPYSWDVEHCAQLFDDILRTGKEKTAPHFTGSIVTIQDGTVSAEGVAPLLLIDGQQRITTISLLLIALARNADARPMQRLAFSRDEIVNGGYLTNHFRAGADHYKLELSKTDRIPYQQLIDNLENPELPAPTADCRLLHNLAYFEQRVQAMWDLNAVWAGLQRLEVVHVALAQGRDNPQLIFESMNATGKDLTCADMVRNSVLMNWPMDEQRDLYRTYWAPVEDILGAHQASEEFDAFLRSYLTVVCAPKPIADADLYHAFKRYVVAQQYDRHGRMINFSLKLKRFARYYAAVTRGAEAPEALADALARVASLRVRAVDPLLLALFDAHDAHALDAADFAACLGVLESYLVRRRVCDCADDALADYVPTLIQRLSAVRSEGANVHDSLAAMLRTAEGAQRFPANDEFASFLAAKGSFGTNALAWLRERLDRADGTSLADAACAAWPMPEVPDELLRRYQAHAESDAQDAAEAGERVRAALKAVNESDAAIALPWS